MVYSRQPLDRGPRFCPGCGFAGGDDIQGPLCPECGETLVRQGYCSVCESYLRLRPGVPCPKHDVLLEAERPTPLVAAAPGNLVSWTTIAVFPSVLAASVLRSRLESEEIPTFLEGERMGSVGMYNSATRGVRLQVPADRVADARIILSQSWALPDDEKAEFDDLL